MKKFRRQMVSGVLALSMLATMLPIPAFAAEVGESLVEVESLSLEETLQQDSTEDKIQSNGETGTGKPHVLSETEVEYAVEGGVIYFDTATGEITDCGYGVTKAEIPSEINGIPVTSIGASAFYSCESLTSVDIPDSVTSIGKDAFCFCDGLTSVTIGDGVISFGTDIFYSCDNLANVTIGGTYIPDNIFFGFDNLTNVTIGNKVTSIGDYAFDNCDNLTSVTIGNSVTSIGENAFYRCESLTSVDIPDSVTSIGNGAFIFCSGLTSVTIGSGMTFIGDSVFSGCDSLTSITIPDSVTSIGDEAFYACHGLTSVTIPDSVTSIGYRAFGSCDNLTSMDIPDSVVSIGEDAFYSCDSLASVDIPDSVTSIGYRAFGYCDSLASVTIGDGVTSFGENIFVDCDSLTSVTIGGAYIPDGMFYGFNNLTNVTIGNKVTSIGNCAFGNCGLTSVTIENGVTSIGNDVFSSCDSLASVDIPDSVTSIGDSVFSYCDSLTSVTIPDSVTSIGVDTFSGCNSLASVTIGGPYIPDGMFYGFSNLTNVTIGNKVTSIGNRAFGNCGLTSVAIGNGVTSIGNEAFSYCSRLTSIDLPTSVISIGNDAFYHCGNLTSIDIPDSVTSIGDSVFSYCDSLTSVTIPDSVTSIGDSAFSSCDNLIDVYYGGSETEWAAISIGSSNEGLTSATIHYNSTGPDDPGTGSEISYVAGILKSYDSQTQELFFEYYDGITEVYEYKVTDQTEVENWDTLIGNPVLVSYIPGEYGTGTLSRYVVTVQPAETRVGIIDAVTDSTITINGEVFNLNLEDFFGLDYYVGQTVVCYLDDGAVVALNTLEKKTGILNAGSNASVTIDGVKYAAIFDGIPPYLSAPELWFEQEVEYYSYNNGANQIIYKVALKPYSSIFTGKMTQWEGTTVTFEDGTIRQTTQDVVFDATLIGKWVDCTIGTTADGGNVITSIELAKPTYRTEVKKMIAWNDGNPQFSDGTTMGVFLVGDQYDPVMIGRWVELTIADDRNTGTKITGISLAVPSSKSDFQLVHSTDIYLKGNQYSFDGQNYENSSRFEIEFKISIQNIVENVSDINLPQIKKDTSMNLTVEDIQITAPDGFNFGWTGSGSVGDGKELAVPVGEVCEVTGFIRPDMLYFVDEKEVTETIACKIVLSNGDVFEKELLFTIHNLDYKEPAAGGDNEEEEIEFTSWEKGLLSEFYKAKDIDVTMQSGKYSLSKYFEDDVVEDICKTVSVWAGILKTDLAAETKGTLPTYLKIQVVMNDENDKHQATLFFKYNNFYDSSYASLDCISYTLVDNKTNRKLISEGLFSASSSASFRNFADGVNAYLKVKYGEEAKDFCKKIMKDAISDSIKDFANITGQQYVSTMLEVLTQFDELKGYIDKAQNVLQNPIKAEISSLKEFNDIAAKCASIKCPVDVWVYNKDNVLCGKIENNSITYDTHEVFMYVENDEKTVWFSDDFRLKLISTDTGSMDYDITEYENGEASRRVEFQNVPLQIGVSYTAEVPAENNISADKYKLTSNNGITIGASEDIDLKEDDSKPETIPVTGITLNMQGIQFSQAEERKQLTATISPANASNKAVTWFTSNPSVATVSDNGLVTAVSEGTATITVTTEDGQKVATCTVTVRIESGSGGTGGGGSSGSTTPTSYAITAVDTDGGAITISPKTASKGQTITITAVPDEGFTLESLFVTDKNGNKIDLTKKTETSYTFKMPASKVTVSATFTEIVVEPEPIILPFNDISQSAWYYGAVEYVCSNDMMQGTSATTFSPEIEMSRGMIATVLYRLENKPAHTGSTSFSDVGVNEWYTDAIQWVAENNIMSGYGNNQFGPMDNVTREQLALIFYNYTASKGISVTTTGDLSAFHDAQYTSDWAKEAISWAVGVGLLSGKGNGILDPTGTATRAEVVQILMNYCTKVM